jgi:hypothetical protein
MRIEFNVQPSMIGVMIGKKGVRVQDIIAQTGVKDISVDGNSGNTIRSSASTAYATVLTLCTIF